MSYADSFLPLQKTNISLLNSIPVDELNYISGQHEIALFPDISADFSGSIIKAQPGFNLKSLEIESDAIFLSAGINYQWIRQRQENLSLRFAIDGRNVNTDILSNPLIRDYIRTMRATISYDKTDNWQGYNIARTTLSHGISGLGSNSARDSNTSRENAKPDFTKLEIAVKRLQGITPEWSLLASGAAQLSSGSLYSSEEFGYGGQEFGRAFDPSEIVGDHGVAGSLELRYNGLNNSSSFNLRPYIFYDIGTVWNEGNAQISRLSAASTGGGIYITSDMDISANLALALPLIQDIETPIYGQNNKSPRLIFSISQSF